MAIDVYKEIVDHVIAYVDRVQEDESVSWDDMYGYMFKKLGMEDNEQNRRLFNVGFGFAAITELRHRREKTDPMA